jgi:hypothetical protein
MLELELSSLKKCDDPIFTEKILNCKTKVAFMEYNILPALS